MCGRHGEGVAGVDGFGWRRSTRCGGVGDASVGIGASRPDSSSGEGADAEAELVVLLDLLGMGPSDGVARRRTAARGGARERERSESWGSRGGEWERVGVGASSTSVLVHQGEQVEREAGRHGRQHGASAVGHGGGEREEIFRENPLTNFK